MREELGLGTIMEGLGWGWVVVRWRGGSHCVPKENQLSVVGVVIPVAGFECHLCNGWSSVVEERVRQSVDLCWVRGHSTFREK